MSDKNNNDFFFNQIKGNIFNDLLGNSFDLAWHYGREKGRLYSIVPSENNVTDDGSVKYFYNSELFRCDEFTNNHEGQHILFSGCSETEGVGGNIEDAWSHILYTKISKEIKTSGFFNLSRAGWGWNRIILNCLIYFKKYGYPDLLFILLPNCQRKFDYSKHGHLNDEGVSMGNWKYIQKYPFEYFNDIPNHDNNAFSGSKEYNQDFVNFLIGWKMFNKICQDNDVKLFFSTWDQTDHANLLKLNMFFNFCNICKIDENKHITNFYLNNKKQKTDIQKRDGHVGRLRHFMWSEQFYNKHKGIKNDNVV